MGKLKEWTMEQKKKIIKEFKKEATISYLNNISMKYQVAIL